jgi:acetyltransferase-like isoleucine patch superfamily enzyme
MVDRLVWMLLRRHLLSFSLTGFRASPFSYASSTSRFEGYNYLYGRSTVVDASLGCFTYVANARVVNTNVGRYCSIGPEALVGGLGRHPTHWMSTHPVFYSQAKQAGITFAKEDGFVEKGLVTIGSDVWIGARAIILDGISIGDGAIIAAGAVVTTDIEPYAVVGGVPARVIRFRYNQEIVERLMKLRWWDWSIDELRQVAHLFKDDDVSAVDRLEMFYRERGQA